MKDVFVFSVALISLIHSYISHLTLHLAWHALHTAVVAAIAAHSLQVKHEAEHKISFQYYTACVLEVVIAGSANNTLVLI